MGAYYISESQVGLLKSSIVIVGCFTLVRAVVAHIGCRTMEASSLLGDGQPPKETLGLDSSGASVRTLEASVGRVRRLVALGSLVFAATVGAVWGSDLATWGAGGGPALEARDDDGAGLDAYSGYPIGSPMPDFHLTLVDNTTFEYSEIYRSKYGNLPMIIVALDGVDPWMRWMAESADSLRSFAENAPSGVSVLFAGYGKQGAAAVAKLRGRFIDAVGEAPEQLYFARTPLEEASGELIAILSQPLWRSARYGWAASAGGEAISGLRLDCKFEWCSAAGALDSITVVPGGDACADDFDTGKFGAESYALVTAASCDSLTEAAERVFWGTSAAGAIVASANPLLEPVGTYDSSWYGQLGTTISEGDAARVEALMGDAANVTLNLTESLGPGFFVAVDARGNLYNLGYRYVQDFRFVQWEAVYLEYLSNLDVADEKSGAFVVPVFDADVLNDMTESPARTVTLPPKDFLRHFSSLVIETELTCHNDGQTDQSCADWDHCVTIWADCGGATDVSATVNLAPVTPAAAPNPHRRLEVGGEPNELARYVTPFRRDVGRWRSDRTALMPLLFAGGGDGGTCNVSAKVTSGTGWALTVDLRFEDYDAAPADAPATLLELVFPGDSTDDDYERDFDSLASYNANKTVTFDAPEAATRVELVATISGHGDCEFEPTSHHYDINGETYSVEFFHAGTMWGCVEEVRNGVEPNEHGTWNYGRDGWCDGSPVDAHVFDVTASVDLGATNELTYRAQSYGDDDARWTSALDHVYLDPVTLTDGCGGYMLMTAYLAFYDVV